MRVTTWTLEMLSRPTRSPRAVPEGTRIDRAPGMSPEYARFLYGLVGGPWRWVDRLGWSREQWESELAVAGTEFLVAYGDGVPLGYVHLQPLPVDAGTHVEIRYFGLVEQAIGRGLGGALLERGIDAAWTLDDSVTRVWVHTCTLDGPSALANYQARGLVVCDEKETEEDVPEEPLGAWVSTAGSPS